MACLSACTVIRHYSKRDMGLERRDSPVDLQKYKRLTNNIVLQATREKSELWSEPRN